MGMLDELMRAAMSGTSGGGVSAPSTGNLHPGLLEHVLGTLNNPQTGGLNALLEQLKAGGLSSAVQSWVGTGPNQSVTGSQISSALGSEQIQQLAARFGISPQQVSGHLAQILPEVVNYLTPQGTVPNQSWMSQAIGLVRTKLLGVS